MEELESLYLAPLGESPRGITDGSFLGFLDTRGGRDPRHRAMHTLLFRWPRWGIDFDRRLWWFVHPRLAAGRFTATVGPSRWRETTVLRLEYAPSRAPWADRILYDELKPLPDGRIIGIGGINADRGAGDHFWFEVQPRPA
ncbi:MAG TPA: hypothetical protein VML75_27660 [Kofleriaceae bacterium]|nr:hypothetical protein [Kofleriaceae bacterium]